MSDERTAPLFENDHNVYILGAGFSCEAGYPLVHNFMDKMREAALTKQGLERGELEAVLRFRKEASAAAYRTTFDPENIEDLFSLSVATDNRSDKRDMQIAIVETLTYCKNAAFDRVEPFPNTLLHENETVEGFEVNKVTGQPIYPLIDKFKLYTGIMTGKWGETPLTSNSFITFNYDLVLEEAFQMWDIPFRYDGLPQDNSEFFREQGLGHRLEYHETQNTFVREQTQINAVSLMKLHGSINWAEDFRKKDKEQRLFHIFTSYADIPAYHIHFNILAADNDSKELVLTPPVWDKGTTQGHRPLLGVWSEAIKSLKTATRIIIIGYSLPPTDAHFRYLLAAGLKDNISLNKIIFINPGLKEGHPSKLILEERIFGVFRRELKEKGILELLGLEAREFFTNKVSNGHDHEALLNRKFPPKIFASNSMANLRFSNRLQLRSDS